MTDNTKREAPLVIRPGEFADLIERLEKATGPDRELDLLIGEAVGAANHSGPAYDRPFRDWAKHYTASIDAALTLVPKGCSWLVNFGRPGSMWARCFPDTDDPDIEEWGVESGEVSSTPAIALCIAALKARAATEGWITSGADQPGTAAIVSNQQDDGSKG